MSEQNLDYAKAFEVMVYADIDVSFEYDDGQTFQRCAVNTRFTMADGRIGKHREPVISGDVLAATYYAIMNTEGLKRTNQ